MSLVSTESAENVSALPRTNPNPEALHRAHSRLDAILLLDEAYETCEAANVALKSCWWSLTKARQSSRATSLSSFSSAYCASDVREAAFSAQFRLKQLQVVDKAIEAEEEEPDLILDDPQPDKEDTSTPSVEKDETEEEDKPKNTAASCTGPFILVDMAELRREMSEVSKNMTRSPSAAASPAAAAANNNTLHEDGLRNRLHKKTKNNRSAQQHPSTPPSSEWTMEQSGSDHDCNCIASDVQEEHATHCTYTDPLELFAGGFVPRELRIARDQAVQALQLYVQAANTRQKISRLLLEETKTSS